MDGFMTERRRDGGGGRTLHFNAETRRKRRERRAAKRQTKAKIANRGTGGIRGKTILQRGNAEEGMHSISGGGLRGRTQDGARPRGRVAPFGQGPFISPCSLATGTAAVAARLYRLLFLQ